MMNLAIFCMLFAVVYAGKVKVYHSILNGGNVDVCVGSTALVTNLGYMSQSYYFDVAEGSYDIDVRVANDDVCTGSVIFNTPSVAIGTGEYSVAAHGLGTVPVPFGLLALVDDNTVAAGDFGLRFAHTCGGAPNVDVLVDGVAAFSDVAYGEDITADLEAGTYTIQVNVAGTTDIAFGPADITFRADSTYTIFASGDVSSLPLTPFVSLDSTAATTRVKVIHAVAELNAPTVDVYVNGALAVESFKYGAIAGYVEIPSLQTTLDVKLEGTTTSVLAAPVTIASLAPDAYFSIIAHGDELPVSLLILSDDNTAPSAGNVNVRFVHASAGSPNVDIIVDGVVAFADVAYGETGVPTYVTVPAASYEIQVAVAGTETIVVGPVDLKIVDSEVITLYAIGIAGNTDNTMLTALPTEDFPVSRVLNFSSAASLIPSFFAVAASIAFAMVL